MTVNRRELPWWSFLMSTAHGAGLMVAPVLIGAGAATAAGGPTTPSPRCRRTAVDRGQRARAILHVARCSR